MNPIVICLTFSEYIIFSLQLVYL